MIWCPNCSTHDSLKTCPIGSLSQSSSCISSYYISCQDPSKYLFLESYSSSGGLLTMLELDIFYRYNRITSGLLHGRRKQIFLWTPLLGKIQGLGYIISSKVSLKRRYQQTTSSKKHPSSITPGSCSAELLI